MSESAERRAQRGVAISFWLLAPYIAIQAVRDLATHHPAAASVLGIVLTASSVVIMSALGITKQCLGRRLGSGATAGEGIQNLMCGPGGGSPPRPGRRRHLARWMARRSGHRPGHRRVVCLGRPPGMARRRLLLGPAANSNGDSNSSSQRLPAAAGDSA